MIRAPSGEQYEIAHGDQRATIVEVGGGLREYSVGGRAVFDPYPREAIRDGARGAPLIPWPNRLGDGRYSFDEVDYQVALTEPRKRNAIHGFLLWHPWQGVEHERDRVAMRTTLFPREGYPFMLDVDVAYELSDAGLSVTAAATNVGERAAPYAVGHHPYLSAGGGLVDDCKLRLEADTRIVTDDERQLPTGREAVDGTPFDFRSPRPIGDLRVDHAFTDLARDRDGLARVMLEWTDGARAELWLDPCYSVVEIYTGDTLAEPRRRCGLGCEPMTCPPNGLQTGEGVVRLDPGQSFTARWGARLA